MNIWEGIPTGIHTPERFANEIPLLETIKEYELNLGVEKLSVSRTFASCIEELIVRYKGEELEETVTIEEGVIKNVVTESALNEDFLESLSSEREKIEYIFKSKRLEQKTYYNLKRIEERLKELPWQSDLAAIYKGTGVF